MAILCNHQRSVPKGHQGQMEKLQEKMAALRAELKVGRGAGACWAAACLAASCLGQASPHGHPQPLSHPPNTHPAPPTLHPPSQELEGDLKLARAGKPNASGKVLSEEVVRARLEKKRTQVDKQEIQAKARGGGRGGGGG